MLGRATDALDRTLYIGHHALVLELRIILVRPPFFSGRTLRCSTTTTPEPSSRLRSLPVQPLRFQNLRKALRPHQSSLEKFSVGFVKVSIITEFLYGN